VSRAAAIGEQARVAGYALAGVEVLAAEDAEAARAAFAALGTDVACLFVTTSARRALGALPEERPELVWAVIPG
jgi:vacuolar-type H+-ATPase subunit F/Vma7